MAVSVSHNDKHASVVLFPHDIYGQFLFNSRFLKKISLPVLHKLLRYKNIFPIITCDAYVIVNTFKYFQ